jgi:chromosome segregation ATPase
MLRHAWLVFAAASTILAQQPADSQTLQALLQEMRQLRQDLNGMTLVGQRVQILLYRIQLQDDVTKKAAQRYDQANAKVRDAERNRTEAVSSLKATEDKIAAARDQNERDRLESIVRELKRRIEMWSNDEAGYRAAEGAAGTDLRTEQAKLSELHQRLDRLEEQLEKRSSASSSK